MNLDTNQETKLVEPKEAKAAIEAAIVERLGENWRDEIEWLIVHESDYLIRMNRDTVNLDFQADLLGEVTITEGEAHASQLSGRFTAWLVLGGSMLIALAIAVIAGVFN